MKKIFQLILQNEFIYFSWWENFLNFILEDFVFGRFDYRVDFILEDFVFGRFDYRVDFILQDFCFDFREDFVCI
ncbi:hypothetical protein DERP_013562 [Dermatophagoides pteronyssinus]|uniref:Uncharacterized protein n=2 Tax=Dermatophagoides pteronyssinus TaxID=6956 RepID=A0ABQ8J5D5_DERPT|nr:hypothetical protein DERP_013562 [Dermatophagoides pteronyssinus]